MAERPIRRSRSIRAVDKPVPDGLGNRMTQELVLIPGIGSDGDVWAGIAPGRVMMPGAATIPAMAREILAGAPPAFALAGHSMGGYIALEIMRQAPERVTRLALLSTSARADSAEQAAAREQVIAAAEHDFPAVAGQFARLCLSPEACADPVIVARLEAMLRRCGGDFVRQSKAVLARRDQRDLLGAIAVPVLVLSGNADRVVSPERSVELAESVPGARFVTLPGCGHIPKFEAPDAVRGAMADWLDA
jgi:pimeloyl-ACP methyl ester carboxylesterase